LAGASDGDTQIQKPGPVKEFVESEGFSKVTSHPGVVSTIQKFFGGFIDERNEPNDLFGESSVAGAENFHDVLICAGEEFEEEHEGQILAGLESIMEVQAIRNDMHGI
jgi:hypothetical protein